MIISLLSLHDIFVINKIIHNVNDISIKFILKRLISLLKYCKNMSNQEKAEVSVVGFKNSKYIGVAKKNQKGVKLPSGFGALMDDLYLTCIGNWGQQGGKV